MDQQVGHVLSECVCGLEWIELDEQVGHVLSEWVEVGQYVRHIMYACGDWSGLKWISRQDTYFLNVWIRVECSGSEIRTHIV